jgi:hypothetical protein
MDTKQRITKRLGEIEEERRRIIRVLEMTFLATESETLRERLADLQQERRELQARLRRGSSNGH